MRSCSSRVAAKIRDCGTERPAQLLVPVAILYTAPRFGKMHLKNKVPSNGTSPKRQHFPNTVWHHSSAAFTQRNLDTGRVQLWLLLIS